MKPQKTHFFCLFRNVAPPTFAICLRFNFKKAKEKTHFPCLFRNVAPPTSATCRRFNSKKPPQKQSLPPAPQLSSGYTSIGSKRYVFHWNEQKFPSPCALARTFRERGLRLAANVKPCLLKDHPQYETLARCKKKKTKVCVAAVGAHPEQRPLEQHTPQAPPNKALSLV